VISPRKTEDVKRRVVQRCAACGGRGCPSCYKYCSFIDRMSEAAIPVDYWMRRMKDWYGDAEFAAWLDAHLADIDAVFRDGRVLCLKGDRGVGKTMAACGVLKRAIRANYTAHYATLVEVVEQLTSRDAPPYRRLLKMVDFLVVDEVDQRFFDTPASRQLYGNHFENVMRLRTQNRLPMVMCTNSLDLDQIFAGEFQHSFASLRAQFMDEQVILGADARKKER
jgi:DNA replication protein DnaC